MEFCVQSFLQRLITMNFQQYLIVKIILGHSFSNLRIASILSFPFFFPFFFPFQAAGLSPSMEQIEMLAQHLPDASLLKLYVSPCCV